MNYNDYNNSYDCSIEDLIGCVITKCYKSENDEELILETPEGYFKFYHEQDCCENVLIDDVTGDLSDLENSPILKAEEATNSDDPPEGHITDSFTWTFYKLATIKGYVDIRWYGESNGYYSESVKLVFVFNKLK